MTLSDLSFVDLIAMREELKRLVSVGQMDQTIGLSDYTQMYIRILELDTEIKKRLI